MIRTALALFSLAAIVAMVSCKSGALGGTSPDGGQDVGSNADAARDACAYSIAAYCYRGCDGSMVSPDNGTCPSGYSFVPKVCYDTPYATDGSGPVPNTCGDDAGVDGARDAAGDAGAADGPCAGYFHGALCYRSCNGSIAAPDGGTCPAGYAYVGAHCDLVPSDGSGPITDTCGDDAASDGQLDTGSGG